jgi:hypothetical protein
MGMGGDSPRPKVGRGMPIESSVPMHCPLSPCIVPWDEVRAVVPGVAGRAEDA